MPYAELHCKTNFSFLQGASHPDELVQRAAELGYTALAVTDVNSLAGVVRACGSQGQRVETDCRCGDHAGGRSGRGLVGARSSGLRPLVPADQRGRRRAAKGECVLTLQDVAEHAEGLLAGVLFALGKTKPRGRVWPKRRIRSRRDRAT